MISQDPMPAPWAGAYEFLILGPLEVLRDGVALPLPGNRPRALLAVLLVHANERVSSDRLAEDLWDGRPPATARSALQMHVHAVRQALGADLPLRTVPGGYLLTVDSDGTDALTFERLVADGREALAAGRAEDAAQGLRAALSLWRGSALAEFTDASFARLEAERLEEVRLLALELRFDADLALGRHAELVPELIQLVATHPARERLHAQLIRALYRAGRQADALAEFQRARHYLVEELGLEPSAELQRLQAAMLAHDPELDPAVARSVAAPRRARARLLAPPTPTIGRSDDLDALRALLLDPARRLTTILGPGGVGKTRMALEAGRLLEDTRADGACFVSLAPLRDPRDVPPALALALELPLVPGEAIEELIVRHLAPRDTLVILDNFEQVLDAAVMVANVLDHAPAVTVLATSREPLRLRAEQTYQLAPLDVSRINGAGSLAGVPAVALFLDVVAARNPAFSATRAELEAIWDLCRRLDGLPLAIELAAGRVGPMSTREVAAALGQGLDVLGEGPRDAPHRQQTLQATLEWSHELLDADERAAFARMAAFAGSAGAAAARAVTQSSEDVFESLASKQLMTIQQIPDVEPRLRMLETVREFARARLTRRSDDGEVRRRHAEVFATLAEGIARDLRRTNATEFARRLESDLENVRLALAWSTESAHATLALRLASGFHEYLNQRAPAEGARWLRAALATPGANAVTRQRIEALWRLAISPVWLSSEVDFPAAEAAARESIMLADQLDDAGGGADSRVALAALMYLQHRSEEAAALTREAVARARDAGDPVVLADALNAQAVCAPTLEAALRSGEQAACLYEENGNTQRYVILTTNLAYVALIHTDDDAAARLLKRARTALGDATDAWALSAIQTNEGILKLFRGEHEQTIATLRQVVAFASEIPLESSLGEATDGIAAACAALGRDEIAATLHGAAHRLNPPHHSAIAKRLQANFFGPARERLGAQRWDTAYTTGGDLGVRDTVLVALEETTRFSSMAQLT